LISCLAFVISLWIVPSIGFVHALSSGTSRRQLHIEIRKIGVAVMSPKVVRR
jgi:hypothetical protein